MIRRAVIPALASVAVMLFAPFVVGNPTAHADGDFTSLTSCVTEHRSLAALFLIDTSQSLKARVPGLHGGCPVCECPEFGNAEVVVLTAVSGRTWPDPDHLLAPTKRVGYQAVPEEPTIGGRSAR